MPSRQAYNITSDRARYWAAQRRSDHPVLKVIGLMVLAVLILAAAVGIALGWAWLVSAGFVIALAATFHGSFAAWGLSKLFWLSLTANVWLDFQVGSIVTQKLNAFAKKHAR